MPKVKINAIEIEVEAGMTVMQACEQAGEEIPRFCYHEKLSIAGNCRMCLVEVKPGPPKPQASCALPVADGMEINTKSEMVQNARKGVMEFLLINHPLDCPICDQGGECDLQDQAMGYGSQSSRFHENKRAVVEKYMGPLINTVMTRCIHCTRCVRFAAEIGGVNDIVLLGRGEDAEISTLEQAVSSELSGNVIDLCPVGALTSKPYAFKARSWEMKKTPTIDVSDAVGANIRVDTRGNEVMRILPRIHEAVNQEWICDKARFSYDGLKYNRLDRPYVRNSKGILQEASWGEALETAAKKIKKVGSASFGAIVGDLVDVEAMFALKNLCNMMGTPHYDCRQDGMVIDNQVRASYLFNTSFERVEEADAILIIGADPRREAPLLNARLRQCYLRGVQVGLVGQRVDLNYHYEHFGETPDDFKNLLSERGQFIKNFKQAKKPLLIMGSQAFAREDGKKILGLAREFADKFKIVRDDWNGFNILHSAASRVGGFDIGFLPDTGGYSTESMMINAAKQTLKLVYLLGADEVNLEALKNCFVIYQGHHGDRGAACADVIFPSAAYTEKSGIYVNMEGRVQISVRACVPPGEAKEDWAIIRALAKKLNIEQKWINLQGLREEIIAHYPHFAHEDILPHEKFDLFGEKGTLNKKEFALPIDNFYLTNPIARASKTMHLCTAEILRGTRADMAQTEESDSEQLETLQQEEV